MGFNHIEETLRKSEKKYATLFEGASDAIFLMSNTAFLECNQKTMEIFGCESKEDILGHSPWEFSPACQPDNRDSKEAAAEYIQKALDGVPQRFYWTHIKKNGTPFNAEVTLNRIDLDPDLFVQAIVRDITPYTEVEKALRDSEKQFRSLYMNASIGLYRTTPDGRIILANPALVRMLGFSSFEELATRNIEQEGFEAEYTRREFREILEQEDAIMGIETQWIKKDGSRLYIRENATVYRNEEGKVIYYEGSIEDITERKLAELQLTRQTEELEELNATKDKFFSIIAHDLKSPFNSIIGFSELILEQAEGGDDPTVENYARIIRNSSQRVLDLLMNLLEWARAQTGRIDFSPEYLETVSLIHEVITISEASSHEKSIAIHQKLPASATVYADKAMLSAILRNLISNAIKFSHQGGRIIVSAEHLPGMVRFSVSDNGTGIREEDLNKLFNIGESFSTPGTQQEKGTGLGLILCREFVEKQGGQIGVESDPGKGSRFWFTIPTEPVIQP